MTVSPLSARYDLTESQLAASLALAGIEPGPRTGLLALPTVAADPVLLRDTGLLMPDGGRLTATAEAALHVLANSTCWLSVVANRAGQPEWTETTIAYRPGSGPYVAQAWGNGRIDLAVFDTAAEVAERIDELLLLSALLAGPFEAPLTFELPAFVAFLSAVDALQAAKLRARLARAPRPEPVLTPAELEAQLEEGLRSGDSRWAVTAAQMVCPVGLGWATGRLTDGLAELQALGLVKAAPSGATFTDRGYALATSFGEIVATGTLNLAVARDSARSSIAQTSVFRTTTAIWVVSWFSALAPDEARGEMFDVSAVGALNFVRGLLEPVDLPPPDTAADADGSAPIHDEVTLTGLDRLGSPPSEEAPAGPRFCSRCGAAAGATRFCESCGHDLG